MGGVRQEAELSKFSKHFARRCAFVALAYVITSWNNGPNNSGIKKKQAKLTHMYAKILNTHAHTYACTGNIIKGTRLQLLQIAKEKKLSFC